MTHIPRNTGLTSIRGLLNGVCRLLVKFDLIIRAVLPAPQHVYVDALKQACDDFLANTDNPRPE